MYFIILITHIILAAIIVPLALFALVFGFTNQLTRHRKIVRWTMPIWLYVSLSGVICLLNDLTLLSIKKISACRLGFFLLGKYFCEIKKLWYTKV